MPFICSISGNFANKVKGYGTSECAGVVLPQKSEADADGMCPVMARLNIGKYSEAAFSLKSVCRRQYGVRGVLQAKV